MNVSLRFTGEADSDNFLASESTFDTRFSDAHPLFCILFIFSAICHDSILRVEVAVQLASRAAHSFA